MAQQAPALVTAHATIHTKGSYTELIAATTYDAYGFWLRLHSSYTTATVTAQLLDIALGTAGNEVVIVSNFLAGYQDTNGMYFFPLFVPAGSRITARMQALITVATLNVGICLMEGPNGPFPIFNGCDTYGADTATSDGTPVLSGATYGSWTSIPAATTTSKAYGAVLGVIGGEDDTAWSSAIGILLQVGYSSLPFSGVTTGVNNAWFNAGSAAESLLHTQYPPVPFNFPIPAGVQLQARLRRESSQETNFVAIYCFY